MSSSRFFVDWVRSVLTSQAMVPIENRRFVLKQPKVMKVRVLDVRENVTVVNLEKIGSLSGIRNEYTSRCDYLVLYQSGDSVTAVFVELKKTLTEETKGPDQLRMALPYFSFLRSLSDVVGSIEQPGTRVSVRYVLLGSRINPHLEKLRLGDPQALRPKEHRGITVRRLVGERLRFSKLLESD